MTTATMLPRRLDPQKTFDAMVKWIHDEVIVRRGAPGLAISVSGTDSALVFLACAKAFEKAGKPDRVAAIHYSEKMPPEPELSQRLAEDPQAFWFQRQVWPWLQAQAPQASFLVDDSIDYRRDGARWGALLDWSVMQDMTSGALRPREESYWVAGTRNRSEQVLGQYSNISNAASVQPIVHLWKSEVLALCEHLGVPAIAMQKSCEADCVCGRDQLAAAHIPEVDILLMQRQGELVAEYAQANIMPSLRTTLQHYIDEQIQRAAFKSQVPYLSGRSELVLGESIQNQAFVRCKWALAAENADSKPLAQILPEIVQQANANMACDMVCSPSPDRNRWLPEALALFATPRLSAVQKQHMVQRVFGNEALSLPQSHLLSQCNARLGHYGFSFPKWRFTSMRGGDTPSLLEQFGMQRLVRENDVRDASLPSSNPQRDELGAGFCWHNNEWYVEYRRGYIVVSQQTGETPITLVIRNSSYFFGRDRLPAPVYVSQVPLSPEQLQAINVDMLESSGMFARWQDIAKHDAAAAGKVGKATMQALDYLDAFDANLSHWMASDGPCAHVAGAGPDHSAATETGGLGALKQFLAARAEAARASGKPALYVGYVPAGQAPWSPKQVQALSDEVAAHPLQGACDGVSKGELTLLSGPQGDLPVIAQKNWQGRVGAAASSEARQR